ncbi:MAG: rubredoxin, partial [Anaerotignum sp.]|nr:rubredoxin [Anaerotignum sp.]
TCDYVYDEVKGEPEHGIQAMTAWADLPLEYVCPVCGVNKESFALYEEQTTIK